MRVSPQLKDFQTGIRKHYRPHIAPIAHQAAFGEKIALALQQGDTSKLVSYVHRMNGSFATVCAVNLAAACNECEIALLRESLNPESAVAIKALLKRLHGVVARMVEGELYPGG